MSAINFHQIENVAAPNFQNSTTGFLVQSAVPYVFTGAGILLLLYLLMGGIQLMVSKGDPKLVQTAKDKITYALIGFIVIFLAYWIVVVVGLFFGSNVIGNVFR